MDAEQTKGHQVKYKGKKVNYVKAVPKGEFYCEHRGSDNRMHGGFDNRNADYEINLGDGARQWLCKKHLPKALLPGKPKPPPAPPKKASDLIESLKNRTAEATVQIDKLLRANVSLTKMNKNQSGTIVGLRQKLEQERANHQSNLNEMVKLRAALHAERTMPSEIEKSLRQQRDAVVSRLAAHNDHDYKIDWLIKAVESLRGTIVGGALPPKGVFLL